ncbi:hypothetical protein [Labilibaculum euxinus]
MEIHIEWKADMIKISDLSDYVVLYITFQHRGIREKEKMGSEKVN